MLASFNYDPQTHGTGAVICSLNQEQVATLLDAVHRCPSGTTWMPKLTVFHGQTATVTLEEGKPLSHNRIYTLAEGIGYSIPECSTPMRTGLSLTVCPMVSADQKSMRVRMNWESCSEQQGTIPLNFGSKVRLESYKDGKPTGPAEVELREKKARSTN